MHRSEITIDLGAIRHNARRLLDALGGAELWAVVKADGYGHGAVDVGRAALEAGASVLCVAAVERGARAAASACPTRGSSSWGRPTRSPRRARRGSS